MARGILFQGEKEVNWNHNPPCHTYIQHKSETKNTRPFKFKLLSKSSLICKNTFQEDQRNFLSGRRSKYFLKNWKKLRQGLFYSLCGHSSPTKSTNKGEIKPSSGRTCITGVERNAGEGCHKGGNLLQGPVC